MAFEMNRINPSSNDKVEVKTLRYEGSDYASINKEVALLACSDRIIIKEDQFKTGFECKSCNGLGHTDKKCEYCKGTKYARGREDLGYCPECSAGSGPLRNSYGYELCKACEGKKTSSIIIPEDSERRPSSGVILGVGPGCNKNVGEAFAFKVGDRVLYSTYSGTTMSFMKKDCVRIMREDEIMCKIYPLSAKDLEIGDVTDVRLEEVGIPQNGV